MTTYTLPWPPSVNGYCNSVCDDKISEPAGCYQHPMPALTKPAFEERAMAGNQSILAQSAPQSRWTKEQLSVLRNVYPAIGKKATAKLLGKTESAIRQKASYLGLRLLRDSEHWIDFQRRAAASKVGKKRPGQSLVLKKLHAHGRIKITPEGRKKLSDAAKERIAKYGHPRGALGIRHNERTRSLIGAKAKMAHERRTPAQKESLVRKMLHTKAAKGNSVPQRTNATWKCGWREIGGKRKFFRSRWEANYARFLQFRKELGEIAEWEHEPETFWFEKIKRGCRSYLPDFRVTEIGGGFTYHEVKGWMDDRSKTKIKRMKKYHPQVVLIVIDSKEYKSLTKNAGHIIPGWE